MRTMKCSPVVVLGVDRHGVGRDNGARWRLLRTAGESQR